MSEERFERLAAWLAAPLGAAGPVRIEDVRQPAAQGYSADTTIFTAAYEDTSGPRARRLVLRSETPDASVYPAQAPGLDIEIDIQRRIMEAVAAHSQAPVAAILGGELDPAAIGTPFFVMEFVDGVVPALDPPYTMAGFFAEATGEQRHAMLASGLGALAAVHAMDWRAARLGWLLAPGASPSLQRQLELWEAYGRRELGPRTLAPFEQAVGLLARHLPAGAAPSLCWGDPRPGNIIWRDFRCVCLTDFEAASIAPPELDLGWWLMFDRTCHECLGVDRLPGEPTRPEQRALYEEAARRAVGDTHLHELFAAMRYSVIVVRVMNRTVERGLMPADHVVWQQNPAVAALEQLLGS